jgi:hypothetical protein
MILASHRIGVMRRNRRVDPKSFELTTECPDCHYKVPPAELMLLDSDHMRCPNCKQDVLLSTKGSHMGTAVPME